MVPITFPAPEGVSEWVDVRWLDSGWLMARRHFFFENSKGGYDADALELVRRRDNKRIRIAKVTQRWPVNDPNGLRPSLPRLAGYAVDLRRKRIAYGINTPEKGDVYVIKLPVEFR
ncbi:MAG: hypothetical protein ABL949_05610 [Fimbriimonadaceae bacterium]